MEEEMVSNNRTQNDFLEDETKKINQVLADADSNSTLDKIAHDMRYVLDGVKKNLTQDSYSDVIPALENMIKEHMVRYEESSEFLKFENDGVQMYVQANEESQDVVTTPQDEQKARKKTDNINKKSNQTNNKSESKNIISNTNKNTNAKSCNKLSTKNSKKIIMESKTNKPNPIMRNNNKSNNLNQIKTPINKCKETKTTVSDNSRCSTPTSNGGTKNTCETRRNVSSSTRGNKNITQSPLINCPGKSNSSLAAIRPGSLIRNYSNGFKESLFIPKSTNIQRKRLVCNINRNVYNPLAQYKEEVDAAIKDRKTFIVKGLFNAIRRALIRRGWIEKIGTSYRDLGTDEMRTLAHKPIVELLDLIRQRHESAELCKRLIRSRLLINHQVDLYWGYNRDGFKVCLNKNKLTLINKIRWISSSYTSKQALSAASKKAVWYHIPGVANLNHPRSYRLVQEGDAEEFIKDFNLTAAMSLLKWIKTANDTKQCRIMSTSGKIPLTYFDFAINECYKFIKKAVHQDIDHEIMEAPSQDWNEFLDYFYKIVHVGNHFKQENDVTELDLVRRASFVLEKLKDHWPYLEMDGLMNIWILKPTNSCRGLGIHMCRTINYVLETIKANPQRRYIIQKYVERPLLIYCTKFDIRQWFLISSCCPLTIWIYRQCYLRFSSQTYTLRKLHESIHLTNNSVQSKYQNHTKDFNLPSFNMWDSSQFMNYLSDIGYPKVYKEIIYPGMKECITAAVLTHYENMEARSNTFELYGADFILTEDFKPWLLEINSNPALYASTPITARLCPRVLEDVIKVVVDHGRNKNASTGGFELLYKGIDTKCQQQQFSVDGKNIKIQKCNEDDQIKCIESNIVKKVLSWNDTETCSQLGSGMKKTLEGLLDLIQKEKQRREEKLLNRSVNAVKLDSEIQTYEIDTKSMTSAPEMSEVAIQS
ncbi:tubulin glycylase 3B-like [Diorhabda sublineata]|uniref:tubulin glycylase 3B-like n=1 Tax=Diorhabda sublineata TaxID=1163346 RepID=UPI0024E15B82|nr:tubulin glycylase 3B-like [Diorhabda sublineata]